MPTDTTSSPARETVPPSLGEYIVATPGTCGGEPRIAGTRIKVRHVYGWVEGQGLSVSQVVEQYPHLTRAAVYSALAYYWAHEVEVRRAADAAGRVADDLRTAGGPSLVARKLAARGGPDVTGDPLSPG